VTAVTVRPLLPTKGDCPAGSRPTRRPSFFKEAREAGVSKQEVTLSGFESSAVPVRLFAEADPRRRSTGRQLRAESRFAFSRWAAHRRGAQIIARRRTRPENRIRRVDDFVRPSEGLAGLVSAVHEKHKTIRCLLRPGQT
jgi:hypothetical protein